MGDALVLTADERTRKAAKIHGELLKSLDPWESEWGNPTELKPCNRLMNQ